MTARQQQETTPRDEARRQDYVRVVLGFACNQAFMFSLFYLGTSQTVTLGGWAFERADLFGVLLCMTASLIVLRTVSEPVRDALLTRWLPWCYAALIVVGSVAVQVFDGTMAIALESLLVGGPAGLMLAAWGRAFADSEGRFVVQAVFVASGLAALACLGVAALPPGATSNIMNLLPLGSAAALFWLGGGETDDSDAAGNKERTTPRIRIVDLLATREQREIAMRLSNKIIAGTVLYGIAVGFVETFASEPGGQAMPALPATLILLVLFCAAALQLLRTGGFDEGASTDGPAAAEDASRTKLSPAQRATDSGLDGVYRLAILVMMAGFLFVPMLADYNVTGEAVVMAGYLGLTCVLLSLFLVMSRIRSQDAALSFAQGLSALYAGELGGIALGNVVESLPLSGSVPYVATACAGLAALFAYLFLFTEQDFRELHVIARAAATFEDACEAIASGFSLSKRESEVLPLALKGRTNERIAQELYISKSTVDTHLRRIYAKTGTHSRQELIDLGERTMQDLSRALRS